MGLHFGGHTTSNRDLTATNRGKLRHPSLRHAGDTRQEGFAWRKTPIATGVGGTEKPQAQPATRHVSTPNAAGVEGTGGMEGQAAVPGTPAVPQRNEAATGFPATASSRSRSAAQQSGTAQVSAVHNSATSDQAVMST